MTRNHPKKSLRSPSRRGMGLDRRGMGLVEILMGLAIAAMMFSSLAFAIQSGVASERANSEYARTVRTVRVLLSSFTQQVRSADAVDVENGSISGDVKVGQAFIIQAPPRDGVTPLPIAYRWNSATRELLRYNNAAETGDQPPRGKGRIGAQITDLSVRAYLVSDPENPGGYIVRRMTLSIEVGHGTSAMTLTATATPRRTLTVY